MLCVSMTPDESLLLIIMVFVYYALSVSKQQKDGVTLVLLVMVVRAVCFKEKAFHNILFPVTRILKHEN